MTGRDDEKPPGRSFADLVGGDPQVARIAKRPVATGAPARGKRRPAITPDAVPAKTDTVSDEDTEPVHRGDVPPKEFADLRSGRTRPEGRLDLHRLDRAQAHHTLLKALGTARAQGTRCMLVIHGRGRRSPGGEATLRSSLPGWLRSPPLAAWVRGFAPALPRDGGDGATYVLLRALRPGAGSPRTKGPR